MENQKLKIIQELMSQLADEMEHSPDDLEHRLGRSKPEADVSIMKIGVDPLKEKMGMDMSKDSDMDGDDDSMEMGDSDEDMHDMPMDDEESLKQRLMRMRG